MIEILKTIFYLILFIIILWGAYYSSKKISAYSLGFTQSKYIRLIDQLRVGKEMGLAIIRIGNKYMLFSLTNNKLELLRELREEELVELEAKKNLQVDSYIPFKHMTDKAGKKFSCSIKEFKDKIKTEKAEGVVKNKDE